VRRENPRAVGPRPAAAALALAICLLAAGGAAQAQTFTMGKECRAQVDAANQMNDAGQYSEALAAFDAIVKKCDTKDGKEAVQEGRARALNGLGRHAEAISAADAAQAAFPNRESLNAYFERAYAEEQMGDMAAATADYNSIIELTEKNQNVAERATIYTKVADLNFKAGKTAEAETYLAKAMELDPTNPDPYVLKGDWAVRAGDYDAAFAAYDEAVAKGHGGAAMYEIRAEARLKQVEDTYGTTNAQELRAQMTPTETEQVCSEVTKALELGLKDMKLDMFAALVCR
jgi:tetratricopeptide (TPR) repeat protein